MDNISQTNSRPVNFSFTQGIGEYSSAQLDQMDIGDLMTLVMTRMLDAKEVQFKQKLEQADARTKKLEGFGDQIKALARLKAEFGADDKDDTKLRDAKGVADKVSSDQWDESSADYEMSAKGASATSSTSTEASSSYGAFEDLSGEAKSEKYRNVNDNLDANLTDEEKTYLLKVGDGDPVLDASIREKYVKVWHDEGCEPPKTRPDMTGVDKLVDSELTPKLTRSLSATIIYYNHPEEEVKTTATDTNWRSDLSQEGQQFIQNVDTFCQSGLANGTLTDADAANIMSGDFKKSDLDALEVSIKNEQDKIGSMNTRDQIDIQKLTNQIDQINNLISTLTKKFNEAATGVINKI